MPYHRHCWLLRWSLRDARAPNHVHAGRDSGRPLRHPAAREPSSATNPALSAAQLHRRPAHPGLGPAQPAPARLTLRGLASDEGLLASRHGGRHASRLASPRGSPAGAGTFPVVISCQSRQCPGQSASGRRQRPPPPAPQPGSQRPLSAATPGPLLR